MAQQTCPACGGRAAIANAQTGSPEVCPVCDGSGVVSVGTADLPFWYPALVNNAIPVVGAGATIQAAVQIQNDSDFLWDRIIASSTGLFSVYMVDNFTSRPLMPQQNIFINGENIAGTSQLPFWLPKQYLLRRTSTVQVSLTDRSGGNNTIQFCLVGTKVS